MVALALAGPVSAGEPIEGFTTPYRTVNVATAETGVVREILVREGETVEAGQVLARLDDDVHASLLAMAAATMQSQGRLEAAQAEQRVRDQRLGKLRELLARGTARQEEVERAAADAEIAVAQVRSIEEDLELKRLDHERARIQLSRREIRAPLRGVVLRRHKQEGEFIGPNDPHLLTIVQLDPLLAAFAVPSLRARLLNVGETAVVDLPGVATRLEGTIEFISPVVEGKSGTMRVEVRLDNAQMRLYSGEPCSLILDTSPATADAATAPQSGKTGASPSRSRTAPVR